jgi:hypothetical protein
MRLIHASLLVGAAVLGLIAFTLPGTGKDPTVHEMTIQLPGGGSETIQYTGKVAPKVSFDQRPFLLTWPAPIAFGFEPSFAALDRIAADMDRQMDTFWRQADTMARRESPDLDQVEIQNLSPGASAYSIMSESFGNNFCSRVTEITTRPNGGKPKVVSRTSGNCNASPGGALTSAPNSSSGAKSLAIHSAIPATSVTRTTL